MNDNQIAAVQRTFADVVPIADQAAKLFYDRLFTIAPDLRTLFRGDMRAQGRKLMTVLAIVVNGLSDLDEILPAVRDLALRHVDYGVEPKDYVPVGEALLWTLREGLGEDVFDAETEAAWAAAYGILSTVMIEAARSGATKPASIPEVGINDVDEAIPGKQSTYVAEHEVQRPGGIDVGIVGGGVGGDDQVARRP